MNRPHDQAARDVLIRALEAGCSVTEAAKKAALSRAMVYKLRDLDPRVAAALANGKRRSARPKQSRGAPVTALRTLPPLALPPEDDRWGRAELVALAILVRIAKDESAPARERRQAASDVLREARERYTRLVPSPAAPDGPSAAAAAAAGATLAARPDPSDPEAQLAAERALGLAS